LIKNYNLPIPRPPERTSKLQKKPPALKRKHPALENMKYLNFFLLLWVIFALLDPNPDGSTDLIESGSGSETLAPEDFFSIRFAHEDIVFFMMTQL
jgi:hypothetical protein